MKGNEKLKFDDESIRIVGIKHHDVVMHSGEKGLMECLADLGTINGGDILEIGFGLHLSADRVQTNPNVKSHTIIEVHPEIYQKALSWSQDKLNTDIILGDWFEILPIENRKFDGIIFDTHLDVNINKFLDKIKSNCKKDTVVALFEYPVFDNRLSGLRYVINDDDYKRLPYSDNIGFLNNQFELKFTYFNGIDFEDRSDKKSLI